jgi:prepilin-type N-terminal cleavage/methylation domain-containing protein
MLTHAHQRPAPCRGGFTLIELLVVLVIMGILAGLAIGMLGTSGTQARIAQTQTILKHLDAIIGQRTEAFRAANVKKIVQGFEVAYESASGNMALTIQDRKAAEILVRKNLFRQLFPTEPRDLWGMDGAEMTADDAPQATQIDNTWTAPELLYWSMTQGTSYGLAPVTLDGIPASAVSQSSNGRSIFVDAWGEPIRLYRWPTELVTSANLPTGRTLIPGLPATTNKDPDDPLKVLEKNTKFSSFAMPPVTTFNMQIGATTINARAFSHDDYHDVEAYHTPLLISAGPDRALGLDEPDSEPHAVVSDAAAVSDNITNRQGR